MVLDTEQNAKWVTVSAKSQNIYKTWIDVQIRYIPIFFIQYFCGTYCIPKLKKVISESLSIKYINIYHNIRIEVFVII